MSERDPNPRNRKVTFKWCRYASGPWNGKYVVRRVVEEDYAAFLSQADAMAFIRENGGDDD